MVVQLGKGVACGDGQPLVLIAGPCVIESIAVAEHVAGTMKEICGQLGISYVFKASYDKANRTSLSGFRGPGRDEGLSMLGNIGTKFGLPVLTDIHESADAEVVAKHVDVLQIPAFLCRQTDLLLAAAATGKAINVKKGQFLAPWDMKNVVEKLRSGGARNVLVTERGTSFGYNTLVSTIAVCRNYVRVLRRLFSTSHTRYNSPVDKAHHPVDNGSTRVH